jgi:hypothetical protein
MIIKFKHSMVHISKEDIVLTLLFVLALGLTYAYYHM